VLLFFALGSVLARLKAAFFAPSPAKAPLGAKFFQIFGNGTIIRQYLFEEIAII
jgi:hypothetical protein